MPKIHRTTVEAERPCIRRLRIDLQDFEYIDIGEELPNVSAVPVLVKSLVFAVKSN